MAANSIQYAATISSAEAVISTANTNRDGTGTIGTIMTAGASGSKILRIVVQATGTTTAGMVRLYLHNGTTNFLWNEVLVNALTPGANTSAFRYELGISDCNIPTGWSVRAAPHNSESFNVIVFSGNL